MSWRASAGTEKPVSPEQRSNTASCEETVGLFEHILNDGMDLRVRVTGRSMIPFLRGQEILTVRKVPTSSLRKGDLIFFRNRQGRPVVHRIIGRIRKGAAGVTFRTKGDALTVPDEPVPSEEVLGKVCKVENGSGKRNLEAGMQRAVNYLIAATSLFEARLRIVLRWLMRPLRGYGVDRRY